MRRQTVFASLARTAALLAGTLAGPALAAPPTVAADIAPVHSLVARVMQGVGEPALILPPGASPHGYAMRPSEAAALADADLVIWMGPALAPWLAHAIESLAPGASTLALLDVPGTTLLAFRDGVTFDHSAEGTGPAGDRDGAQQPQAAVAEAAHDHGAIDPHAWLDPRNAATWLGVIAERFAALDPENATAYRENARNGQAELDALADKIAVELEPVRTVPFIVFHDGYHYFEHRFGIEATGAISDGDAAPPGPARIASIRDTVAKTGAACAFTEPQLSTALIGTVTEGTGARAAILDPLGITLTPGPALYPTLLGNLADTLRDCLAAR